MAPATRDDVTTRVERQAERMASPDCKAQDLAEMLESSHAALLALSARVETLERERDEPKLSDHINRANKRRIAELESTLAAQTAELARLRGEDR